MAADAARRGQGTGHPHNAESDRWVGQTDGRHKQNLAYSPPVVLAFLVASTTRRRAPAQRCRGGGVATGANRRQTIGLLSTPEVSVLDQFQELGRDMYLTGLVSSHTGTMSVRQDGGATITRRGAMLGHLGADDLVELSLEEEGPSAPDDAPIHQAIYRATDAKAIIHARPPCTMALALVEDRLSPASGEGAETLGSAPVLITQRAFTSPDVAQLIGRILRENRVVALRGHGVFARGDDLADALRVVSLLEEMCKVVQLHRSLVGEEPQPFVRDRQPTGQGHPAKNGGAGGGRRTPSRTPQPRPPSGGGGGWRRDEGPPRRSPNEPRQPGGPRRGAPHR